MFLCWNERFKNTRTDNIIRNKENQRDGIIHLSIMIHNLKTRNVTYRNDGVIPSLCLSNREVYERTGEADHL